MLVFISCNKNESDFEFKNHQINNAVNDFIEESNYKALNQSKVIVMSFFKYDNDTHCDLRLRWSRDGKKVCFDSIFEGHREVFMQ